MHPLLFQDTKHENHIAILWARLLAKLTYYCAHIVDKKIYNIVEKLKQIKKEQQRILRSFQTLPRSAGIAEKLYPTSQFRRQHYIAAGVFYFFIISILCITCVRRFLFLEIYNSDETFNS